jgi:hypothetical protein
MTTRFIRTLLNMALVIAFIVAAVFATSAYALRPQQASPASWPHSTSGVGHETRASRIAVYTKGSITDDPDQLKRLRDWAAQTMPRFESVTRKKLETIFANM